MPKLPTLKLLPLALLLCAACATTPKTGTTQWLGSPRKMLAVDESKGRIAIVDEGGKIYWQHPVRQTHCLQVLPGGHVLFQDNYTHLLEVDPATGAKVWEYDATRANRYSGDQRVEVHAFQRLADGTTMIAESGTSRILFVDKAGAIVRSFKLKVSHADSHRDTRMACVLPSGHVLVPHEGDGVVREYDTAGAVVWEYAVPLFGRARAGGHDQNAWGNQAFSAVRLPSGNTLIGTGNGHGVLEVNPKGEIVWQLSQNELPGIHFAWVTMVAELPSGNILVGNCHAGPNEPQLVEVTRAKKVVWTYKNFDIFGNSLTNAVPWNLPVPPAAKP